MEDFKTILFLIIVFAYVAATPLDTYYEKVDAKSELVYRLPGTIVPTYYYISYNLDPKDSEFKGNVLLYFEVPENIGAVNKIYLHADLDFLNITRISLNTRRSCNVGNRYEADILLIDCNFVDITGDDNTLSIDFTGKFSTDDGFGLVKTSYFDQGIEEILIESNFKPTYARRAFPCMDEPNLKASFSLSITCPEEYTVISNTPILNENSESGIKTTEFEETPKMSTYLFSIFFSKLKEAIAIPGNGYEVKVFTRPEVANMNLSTTAGTYSDRVIRQLIRYTGASYNNLNASAAYQVALPNYYSNVMGDFGLFTYSESDLLDEGDKTTAMVKQNIITNIAYKLSHEWYGGNVSTKWWSDIWANEAVATYFKYIIPDEIEGSFELRNQFVVEVIQKALQYDAMPFAQPLSSREYDVSLPRDIQSKLDSYSYLKGASILHMLEYVFRGEENVEAALRYHFKQRQNLDTDGEDILYDMIESQDEDSYYRYMRTWAFSPGFPLVSVTLDADESDDEVDVTRLSQEYILDLMEHEIHIPSESYDGSHIDLLKTVMVLKWACDLGHSDCIEYATNKYKDYKEDQTSLKDYNFRSIIFCNGIRHSDNLQQDSEFLWNVYSSSSSVHERLDILNALGCAEDKNILLSHLHRTISSQSGLSKQDSLVVFKSVFSSSLGLNACMEFLQDHLDLIVYFHKGVDILSEMLYAVAEKLVTDEHLEWIKEIVNSRVLNNYDDIKSRAIILVAVNNYWKHHYQSQIVDLFPAPTTTTTTTTTVTSTDTAATSTTTGSTSTTMSTTTASSEKIIVSAFISALSLVILWLI